MLLLCAATVAGAAEINNYAERVDRLKQVAKHDFKADLPTREAADNIARAYLGLFEDLDLASIKDQPETLKSLYDASDIAAFYTDSAYHARKMQLYFDLLKAGGDTDTSRGANVYRAYLAAEDFTAAADFSAANPALKLPPPPAIDAPQAKGELQEWIIRADGKELAAAKFALPSGPYLLVASSVRCHFSLASMRALQDFPDLDRLNGRSKWLMRMERQIDFAGIAQWNKAHTAFQFSIPRNYPAWTVIDRWDTPTFYFFNNGKLVYQFAGWPKQGNMENIKRGMREAGFYNLPR